MIHTHKDCRGNDGGCPEDCRARSRTWTTEQPGKTDAVSEKGKAAAVSIHSGGAKPEAGSLNAVLGILYRSWPFPSHYGSCLDSHTSAFQLFLFAMFSGTKKQRPQEVHAAWESTGYNVVKKTFYTLLAHLLADFS